MNREDREFLQGMDKKVSYLYDHILESEKEQVQIKSDLTHHLENHNAINKFSKWAVGLVVGLSATIVTACKAFGG